MMVEILLDTVFFVLHKIYNRIKSGCKFFSEQVSAGIFEASVAPAV